ncbi:MAG TPA: flagellar protein FlbA [Brevundimonas sp.]|uniref:tetratricopeptide repeat protein n=1 Tax=Brevundimonas sp. TaxID=1871086 RepID=UPI0026125EE4|nr:tetratricopeptide repeat protein [Brevundimonas sp.]HRO33269.1 flagellar protein FlbA [Brevundimonas sp.]
MIDLTDLAHALQPAAQGTAGDAASPEALRRLARDLASGRLRSGLAVQKKAVEKLRAALAAVQAHDYHLGAKRCLEALDLDERNGLAWHILAICQEKAGEVGQALNAYEAALKLLPHETEVAHDLGRLAQRLGYLEIAEKLLVKYLAANPGHVDATNNLACVQRDAGRYDEAVATLRDLIAIEPGSALLWNTLGTVMSDQGDMHNALIFLEEALRLDPDFAKARYNRANVRQPLGDEEGALADLIAAYEGAEPGYEQAMMTMARAMLLMGMGRIPEGFEAYEARLDPSMPEAMRVVVDAPRWDPATTDIAGKRLLIVGEQGIADEMIFGGCIPDAIDAVGPDGQVYLAVEARLVDMYQRSFPRAVVGAHRAVRLEGRLTRFCPFMEDLAEAEGIKADAWVPMASLLAQYRRSLADFPDTRGYLKADPARVAHWKSQLEALGPELKIGLHWKSLVLTGVRSRYFSSFERWKPVLTTPGCRMINLQCGDVSDDLAAAQAAGVEIWTPPIDLRNDLEDVAALSVACDLVVGPGIAGTNLAATTGARTWLIHAPDDWHLMGTDRYVFYPHVRTFATGGFDGWPRAIQAVRDALDQAVAGGWNDG